jgi:hypothetical protein
VNGGPGWPRHGRAGWLEHEPSRASAQPAVPAGYFWPPVLAEGFRPGSCPAKVSGYAGHGGEDRNMSAPGGASRLAG